MTTSSNDSLSEVHGSVDTTVHKGRFRKLLSFLGPAYLVSVGYMDPGNWATDIAGGSRFGYALIWVLLMSNLMAVLLQSLSARLGIVRGRDLAQASRETYSRPVNLFLWFLAEIAIAATDLAEVLGMAIGIQLLFGLPLIYGVLLTVLDTFLLLFLLNFGIRKIEAFILSLISIIGLSFLTEMILAKPDLSEVVTGFVPSLPNEAALYIAIGIIGATVMPHNLYLHSSLVQTRRIDRSTSGIRRAIRFNFIDSVIALNLAFFVNAAILVLAASTFFRNGMFTVSEIQDAHHFLEPLLGSKLAPVLFAVALIAAGQSSTVTGTLAGQIVMEGYLHLRLSPWIRRIITRLVAIIPALLTIHYFGESATGELLVLSQVILSLQLGFAIIPLIHFTSDKEKMGDFRISWWVKSLAWLSATIIVGLNVRLVIDEISAWLSASADPTLLAWTVIPLALSVGALLLYVTIKPLFPRIVRPSARAPHGGPRTLGQVETIRYSRIAITVDFSQSDEASIASALGQGGKDATYCLIHVVESAGAMVMRQDIRDMEMLSDRKNLEKYQEDLSAKGFKVEYRIGFGTTRKAIPDLVKDFQPDLLVMGAHGHMGFKDLLFGTTVDKVRHRVQIPVLVVRP
ncbi:MAG: Nramp family divalent metal transporter [Bacteroidia bacterium]|nr:Nramp family divalent metal transporter [Bacteroidia bacterium]